jgi:hypothetical protein
MHTRLPQELASSSPLPDVIQGYVSVRSQGGQSVLDASLDQIASGTTPYRAAHADIDAACKALDGIGFTILATSRVGIAVAGKPGAFEELTGGQLVTFERLMHAEAGRLRYVTHVDVVGSGQPEARCIAGIKAGAQTEFEGVLVERPCMLQGVFPAPIPPIVPRFYLRVPDDVALLLNAIPAHRQGHVGAGVKVAMVDSGQETHPFFVAHGYDVRPPITVVPGTSPAKDPVGHGTGESANIFAVAPQAELHAIRASNNAGALVGAIAGFLRAKQLQPAILTNSWGGDGPFPPSGPPDSFDIAWAIEILDAIEQGIFVVFSAGNGSFTIEPQVPNVLAAGGVFATADLALRASNYTSGYPSPWFQGVTVPDVSGLVGTQPRAKYIMLPIPPECEIDRELSQPALPNDPEGDGTTSGDGWALFSGTSAAAPQVAGAAAAILAAKPGLNPLQVTQALTASAVDVTLGRCHPRFNNSAQAGPDAATGHGLLDVAAAVQFALANF